LGYVDVFLDEVDITTFNYCRGNATSIGLIRSGYLRNGADFFGFIVWRIRINDISCRSAKLNCAGMEAADCR